MDDALDEVCSRMNSAWFPVNPLVLSRVQSKLASGAKTPRIVEDLKSDPSLFIYTVKELSRRLNLFDGGKIIDPVQELESASVDTMQAILTKEAAVMSCHDFRAIKSFQAGQLMSSLISAVTSASLAGSMEVNASTAYACALLRQLGLTLIAFNYPHVYANAIGRGESRDSYISMMLGFSPSLLAFAMARKWGLAPTIRRGMGDISCSHDSGNLSVIRAGEMLEKICAVGEIVARIDGSKDPQVPSSDWEEARSHIQLCLGKDGFSVLEKEIAESARYFVISAPELFTIPDLTGDIQPEVTSVRPVFDRNPFIRGCSGKLQERLGDLYARLVNPAHRPENVRFLLKTIIPEAGFAGGCVYLVDIEAYMLVPRLSAGKSSLDEFKAVRYNTPENRNNPIVRAFMASTPVTGDHRRSDEKLVSFVASSIGFLNRAGVLYLEAPLPQPGLAGGFFTDTHRTECKALRQALNDCLNLE